MRASATDPTECVANLVIAGVGKSGTSSMFAYLAAHPDVCPATTKETHFFDPVLEGGALPPLDDYAKYWAHAAGERYRLEATPLYCLGGDPMLDAFATHLSSDLRVLILLREPVERLAVNFAYMQSRGRVPADMTFDSYVTACLARRPERRPHEAATEASAWRRSFYGDYLGPWVERLGPRLRLVWFEDLATDPRACVAEVCRWLDLDPTPLAALDYRVHNPTTAARNRFLHRLALSARAVARPILRAHPALHARSRDAYLRLNTRDNEHPTVSTSTYLRLQLALADSNDRLAALLADAGCDELPAWLTPPRPAGSTAVRT